MARYTAYIYIYVYIWEYIRYAYERSTQAYIHYNTCTLTYVCPHPHTHTHTNTGVTKLNTLFLSHTHTHKQHTQSASRQSFLCNLQSRAADRFHHHRGWMPRQHEAARLSRVRADTALKRLVHITPYYCDQASEKVVEILITYTHTYTKAHSQKNLFNHERRHTAQQSINY